VVYCNINDIISEAKIKPAHFGLETREQLEERVYKWAEEAQSWINEYTENTFPNYPDEELPRIITLACEEIIHNIIISRRARQDGQYIKSNDWTLNTVPYTIFTDEIKAMLAPYVKADKYCESNVDFFVVTGASKKDTKLLDEED